MTPADELLARLESHATGDSMEYILGSCRDAATLIRALIAERDEWKIKWADARSAEVEAKRALATAREEGRREMAAKALAAWDALPSGRYHPDTVEKWLNGEMQAVMREIRQAAQTEGGRRDG